MRIPLLACFLSLAAYGQDFPGHPAVTLSNGRIEVALLKQGASIASIVLKDDPAKLNPLWVPPQRPNGGFGSFLCVDGFGGVSPEEAKAGLSGHGEAIRTMFDVAMSGDGVKSVTMTATLPMLQERVTRRYELKEGENVLYVRTRLESLVAFDRPLSWAEHATIGSPFLERAVTAVDQSGRQSQTRPYTGGRQHRLPSGKDFTWPDAPLLVGGTVDLRMAPAEGPTGDHSTTLQDRSKTYAWATAVNPKLKKVVGWIWRSADFPWLQNWESYPATGMLARGLEFTTQPYDVSRRDAVAMNPMFGAPTFRWLPAKSAIETSFVLFYVDVPEGFNRVQDLTVGDDTITLIGPQGARVRVPASLTF